MRLLLASVGKPRNPALAAAIHEYEERARRYWPFEVIEVREESARGAGADHVRRRESERLAEAAGDARLIACDVGGRRMTSEEFAGWLQRLREEARDAAFVIGGAYGLAPELATRASARLSLSPLTLPHELARLVLVEQFYRAGTIVRGEPYHK